MHVILTRDLMFAYYYDSNPVTSIRLARNHEAVFPYACYFDPLHVILTRDLIFVYC